MPGNKQMYDSLDQSCLLLEKELTRLNVPIARRTYPFEGTCVYIFKGEGERWMAYAMSEVLPILTPKVAAYIAEDIQHKLKGVATDVL